MVRKYHRLFGFEVRSQLKDDCVPVPSLQSLEDSSSDSSVDTDTDDESSGDAYESWSECSSNSERDGFDWESEADDHRRLQNRPFQDPISTDSEDDEDDMLTPSEDSDNSEELDSDHSRVRRRELGGYQIHPALGEEGISSDEEEAYGDSHRRTRRETSSKKNTPFHARLYVYDVESPQRPKELFSFSKDLQLPLYDSPPIIHPTQALVVWPLSGGQLLFGDFEANSYFIRKLKPSTSMTRHIFMKCHFSTCGKFLHVASLEGMADTPDGTEPTSKAVLAIVTYTFLLCSSQPTRTQPTFVHQARIDLGQYTGISVIDLPFTLTWSQRMLYMTERSLALKVYRMNLFPDTSADESVYPVFRPEKTIAMPGCFLNEESDLGGWVRSAGTQDVPDSQGDGRLIRPTERFNPEEDCDLRPFLFMD
ncbi:hypothetical protein H0H87_012874 [Tephrocybe sp. NHM501043]|nr:hypothetical protein H0H87_012874 [Tephrocybe sp. NHM501043]